MENLSLRIKVVEIGVTMFTIIHGDSLEDFVLHIPTILGSVNLELQLLPGQIGFLLPGDQLSNKVFPHWQG